MKVFIGEVIFMFGVLYFCVILLAARNPERKSWWIKPIVQESFHLFLIMGSGILGLCLIVMGLLKITSAMEFALHSAVLLVFVVSTIWIIKKMRIEERLADYDARSGPLNVIEFFLPTPSEIDTPNGVPTRKAA